MGKGRGIGQGEGHWARGGVLGKGALSSFLRTTITIASYLDPLMNGPSGYHRRLTEIAILVSDTVKWEKKKTKRSKQSASQGSLSV